MGSRVKSWSWFALLFVVAAGCGTAMREGGGDGADGGFDGDGGRPDRDAGDGVPPRCDPTAPFGDVTALGALNDDTAYEGHVSLPADERSIFFHSDRSGGLGGANLYVATRSDPDGSFGSPVLVPNVNETGVFTRGPSISRDGRALFFSRSHPTAVRTDIYVATRTTAAGTFSSPMKVANVNPAEDAFRVVPYLSESGLHLYFQSDEDGTQDVFVATRDTVDGPFGAPTPVGGVSTTTFDEISPVLSADERTIYFARRPDADASARSKIYVAQRSSPTGSFGTAQLVAELDAGADNSPSFLSSDGCVLYFARSAGAVEDSDMFVATRPE